MDAKIYSDLLENFSEEEIFYCVEGLYQRAEYFLSNGKFPKSIYLNKTIYLHCWRDILQELAKVHNFKLDDSFKLHSCTAAWWIRRKPFQHKAECEEKFLYVNEFFATTILLQASNLYDKESGQYTIGREKVLKAVAPLMQYLKFQEVNSQTLELFLFGLNFIG